jgi:hypothetical protein
VEKQVRQIIQVRRERQMNRVMVVHLLQKEGRTDNGGILSQRRILQIPYECPGLAASGENHLRPTKLPRWVPRK